MRLEKGFTFYIIIKVSLATLHSLLLQFGFNFGLPLLVLAKSARGVCEIVKVVTALHGSLVDRPKSPIQVIGKNECMDLSQQKIDLLVLIIFAVAITGYCW